MTQRIAAEGGYASAAVGDLATDEGAVLVVDMALTATGWVDILVNNAGTYVNRAWMQTTAQGWTEPVPSAVSVLPEVELLQPQA